MGSIESSVWEETQSYKHILRKKKDTNHFVCYYRKIGKEQTKPRASREKEILKIQMKINEVENRKTIKEISENRIWFWGRSTEMETFR